MKGMRFRSPHIENILSGRKTWEMRSSRTSELNRIIALIKSKSGTVIGTCKIGAVHGPLTREATAYDNVP
jgi:hypothetical protein